MEDFEGGWGDEEVESTGSFERNTELELLKLGQRIGDLERRQVEGVDLVKEFARKAVKEQQFYIEALHQDLETIERNRLRMYKEEEAERAKLLEDIIRLYEKMRS